MTVLALMTSYVNTAVSSPSMLANNVGTVGLDFNTSGGGTGSSSDFDNTYARGIILGRANSAEPVLDLGADYDEFWLHFDVYATGAIAANGSTALSFYSEDGEWQYAWLGTATGSQYQFFKSTNNTSFNVRMGTGQFTLAINTRSVIDIHVKNDAVDGIFDVYVNGSIVSSFSGDTSTNGANAVRYIRFRTATANNSWDISQVIAADVPTIGWKVQELPPLTGTQEFNQWTGTFSDCDDFDLSMTKADSLYTNVNNNTESFVVADVPAGAASMFVVAVALSARVMTTLGSSVETFTPGLSVGGTFYEGDDYPVVPEDGEQSVRYIWHTNPATSSGWTQSDVNSMQIGVRAKT